MKFTLELSLEEMNVLLAGLGKLPLEVSIAVFGKVREQLDKQLKAQEISKE